jgi:hypothetical protein
MVAIENQFFLSVKQDFRDITREVNPERSRYEDAPSPGRVAVA